MTLLKSCKTKAGSLLGVLDTPCRPARYYAGPICTIQGDYFPSDNSTCKFHRTITEAAHALRETIKLIDG